MQIEKPTSLLQNEIVRYISCKNTNCKIDKQMQIMINACEKQVLDCIAPKMQATKVLPFSNLQDGIFVPSANITLQGEDIKKHLKDCHSIVIIAVTLGQQIDNLLLSKQLTDMASYVVIDACANTAIEQVTDMAQKNLLQTFAPDNLFFTCRYSPGYGDFDISIQTDIINILQAQKTIGLCVTQTKLLTPQKSITAIIGVSDVPVTGKLSGCKTCALRKKCDYKKRGTTCGV